MWLWRQAHKTPAQNQPPRTSGKPNRRPRGAPVGSAHCQPKLMAEPDEAVVLFLLALGITLLIQLSGWLHGFMLQTEKYYDLLGGVNSLALVGAAVAQSGRDWAARQFAAAVMLGFSRAWLLFFLFWRAHSRHGDGRFADIKQNCGAFLVAWLLQATWVLCVAMPFIVVAAFAGEEVPLDAGDVACIVLFALGLGCQVASDVQKARWVAAGRPGGFCRVGLWRWSRHPNYFGEILMWWSAWGLCVHIAVKDAAAWPWVGAAVLSPAVTTVLLLFVSGIPTAEGQALRRYAGNDEYQRYRSRTSPLIPLPCWPCIPKRLRCTLFCEFPMYE